jgi:CheY-like chemotaxis protein/tRNA A-37 threonylcarbamoyl transferase component Bud32
VLRVTARVLRASGATVTECESGPAAVALIEAGSFDVIVSDIDMPGLSGVALLKVLRDRGIDVPVVLVTGAPSLDTAMKAVELGAFKYLTKPVRGEELRATVERAAQVSAAAAMPVTRSSIDAGVVLPERYRLTRLIGEGGMSEVWQATQLRTGRRVAVKLLHASLNAKPEMRKRLLREARAASQIGHPGVVDVLDAFELVDGTPVLVMALLKGRTLAAHLARTGRLPLASAADLLLPVVSAVGTAHERGVIHRDLKPENVFLADEGGCTVPKVLDFGLAKLVASDDAASAVLTATGMIVGTPGYMSPEQGAGEPGIDARADVWSMGAILYETLTGARAVRGDSVGERLKVLFTESIAPLRDRVPEVPEDIASLVDRMLEREKSRRPEDLREVHAALAGHASVTASSFGPPSVVQVDAGSGVVPRAEAALALARTEHDASPALLRGSRRG